MIKDTKLLNSISNQSNGITFARDKQSCGNLIQVKNGNIFCRSGGILVVTPKHVVFVLKMWWIFEHEKTAVSWFCNATN